MNAFSIEKGDPKSNIFTRITWYLFAFYRFDFKKSDKYRILSKIGNLYNAIPILFLLFCYYYVQDVIFNYILYIIIIILYFPYVINTFYGEFRWNSTEVILNPHPYDITQYIYIKRQRISWNEITEINVVKPLQRISVYAGKRQIEFNIIEPFVSDKTRKEAEFALLAFARYARLKLRNKPGVVWST